MTMNGPPIWLASILVRSHTPVVWRGRVLRVHALEVTARFVTAIGDENAGWAPASSRGQQHDTDELTLRLAVVVEVGPIRDVRSEIIELIT
jgi:predicted deacylase